MPPSSGWEIAPAKVNLSLRVTGRRDDGYHLLDSLVAFADVGDRLRAEPAERLSLSLTGPFGASVPESSDNLVLRAAQALARATGIGTGAALTLDKRLPVASGIGGGSADAAAAIRVLSRLWNVSMPDRALAELALSLGADVPVCLSGRPCRMTGIGETLSPVPPLPTIGILLVNPRRPCPTPAVFKARHGEFSEPGPAFDPGDSPDTLIAALASERNDLTDAARTVCPDVTAVLEALEALQGCRLSRLSGSGATCFGLFDTEAAARRARGALNERGWWSAAGSLLP